MQCEPTTTRFYLDTLKYTKKWVLDFPYPENVTVKMDPEPEATYESNSYHLNLHWVLSHAHRVLY